AHNKAAPTPPPSPPHNHPSLPSSHQLLSPTKTPPPNP
ncbi:hypothetical protein ACFDR9_005673, partial [Janthinobacterium sp. CG_23.3]